MTIIKQRLLATALATTGMAFGALVSAQAPSADPVPIHEAMMPEEFRAAGLHKLSAEELDALDKWLNRHSAAKPGAVAAPALAAPTGPAQTAPQTATAPVAATTDMDNFGLPEPSPAEKNAGKQLEAAVLQPFRGWTGKTVFRLDNGQVWQQRVSGRYIYSGDDTRVAISTNRFGFYEMELLSVKRSVGVKRIK